MSQVQSKQSRPVIEKQVEPAGAWLKVNAKANAKAKAKPKAYLQLDSCLYAL